MIGDSAGGFFPHPLRVIGRAEGLDGLDRMQGFDQMRILVGGRFISGFDTFFQRFHQNETVDQNNRNRHQRHDHHRPADIKNHQDENNREGQIDQRRQCGCGKKVADAFEFPQLTGERANRFRPLVHFQIQCLRKQDRRHDDVAFLAGDFEQVIAHETHRGVEQIHHQNAGGEHPQRSDGVIRHHLVVNIHGEQRGGENEQIDHHRGQRDADEDFFRTRQRAPEPVAFMLVENLVLFLLFAEFALEQKGVADIFLLQSIQIQPFFAFAHLRKDDFGPFIFSIDRFEYAGVAVFQNQNTGQQQAGNLQQLPMDQTTGESGAIGDARKQPLGFVDAEQLWPARAGLDRQTGDQRIHTHGAAMNARENNQALQQWIVMMMRIGHIYNNVIAGDSKNFPA